MKALPAILKCCIPLIGLSLILGLGCLLLEGKFCPPKKVVWDQDLAHQPKHDHQHALEHSGYRNLRKFF